MDNTKKNVESASPFTRSLNLLDCDPLEEIFALNLGEFLTEHLINPDLAEKISHSVKDKNNSLKDQLKELISIYSIDNTLSLLGFGDDEEYVIYNSIAKTVKLMLSLESCNIYLCKKGESELKLTGSANHDTPMSSAMDYVVKCWQNENVIEIDNPKHQILVFPMKNNFECIGAIEISRQIQKPLEKEYSKLLEITAGLFVTSLGIQKLIDEVKKVIQAQVVSTGELQNLRAQLTAIIGDLGDQQQTFVEALATAVDVKKGGGKTTHSKCTAELSREICVKLNLNEKTTDLIYYAGLLQNIGQITLDEELFNKKEKLTELEWEKLQNSPNAGVSLLMNINFLSEVVPYIHYQKERWDGKGKPEGLGGFSIPFGSRIIAVADAYCALTSKRHHREAMSGFEAIQILQKEAGIKWDPAVVEAICEIKG